MIFNVMTGRMKVPVLNASYPADASVTVTNSVELRVVIQEEGCPADYTYQWYQNGSPVAGATAYNLVFDTNNRGGQTHTFYCVVSNAAGSVQSRAATISVVRKNVYSNGITDGGITGYGWYDQHKNPDNFATVWEEYGNIGMRAVGPNSAAVVYSNKAFDLTGINTVVFAVSQMVVSNPNNTTYAHFGVSNSLGNAANPDHNYAARTTIIPFDHRSGGLYGIAVDVSALRGSYHVKASIERNNYYEDWVYVSEIYLI